MTRRRGLLADIQRIRTRINRAQQRRRRAAQQAATAHQRQAAKQHRAQQQAAQQAQKAAQRAAETHRKQTQQHRIATKENHARARQYTLNAHYTQLNNLLHTALNHTTTINLDDLRKTTPHQPATYQPRNQPPKPQVRYPAEPTFIEPPPETGFTALLGGTIRHAARRKKAHTAYLRQRHVWQAECQDIYTAAATQYDTWCRTNHAHHQRRTLRNTTQQRQHQATAATTAAHNKTIDTLHAGLIYHQPQAINRYFTMVLERSEYPDEFPISHHVAFNAENRELVVSVTMPAPQHFTWIKSVKYVKTRDAIETVEMSLKDRRATYANVVWQVALRTVHEIFSAGQETTFSDVIVQVRALGVSPATGQPANLVLAHVAASRDDFQALNLKQVVPEMTLRHLGAAMSKSPYDLTPVSQQPGGQVVGTS